MNLTFLSHPLWWDVIFLIILFLCIKFSADRGAFRAISGMAGTFLGVILGNRYQDALAPYLEPVLRPVLEKLTEGADLSGLTGLQEGSALSVLAEQAAQLPEQVGALYLSLMTSLAEVLTVSLAPIFAFMIIFLISKAVLQLLCGLLDLDIPVLSGINHFAGGLLGAITGVLTVLAICWAVMRFAPAENMGLFSQPCLQQSFIGSLLAPMFATTL